MFPNSSAIKHQLVPFQCKRHQLGLSPVNFFSGLKLTPLRAEFSPVCLNQLFASGVCAPALAHTVCVFKAHLGDEKQVESSYDTMKELQEGWKREDFEVPGRGVEGTEALMVRQRWEAHMRTACDI